MQPPGSLADVLPCAEVDLQRLEQLLPHPGIGQQRSQLLLDGSLDQVTVKQEGRLEGELVLIAQPATSAQAGGHPGRVARVRQRVGEGLAPVDGAGVDDHDVVPQHERQPHRSRRSPGHSAVEKTRMWPRQSSTAGSLIPPMPI